MDFRENSVWFETEHSQRARRQKLNQNCDLVDNLIKPEVIKKIFWYTSVFDHLTAVEVHALLPLTVLNESKKDWE